MNWYIKYPNIDQQEDYYMEPFHPYLWSCILGYILLGSVWGFLIKKITEFYNIFEKISTVDCLFIGFECFCNQLGWNHDIKKFSFRIIGFTFQLTAFFVIPAYAATIISYLAIKIPIIPFTNLMEFVENGEYVLAFHKYHFLEYYFLASIYLKLSS